MWRRSEAYLQEPRVLHGAAMLKSPRARRLAGVVVARLTAGLAAGSGDSGGFCSVAGFLLELVVPATR